jgi:hypothetical protein
VIAQELDVEQSDDPDRIVWRGRGRPASANDDGSENQERRNPQHCKPRATGSEETFAPAKAPTTASIGRDLGSRFGFATRHRLSPYKNFRVNFAPMVRAQRQRTDFVSGETKFGFRSLLDEIGVDKEPGPLSLASAGFSAARLTSR